MSRDGLSVIIPALNEEETIGTVVGQVDAALRSSGWTYEVLVVDDGSTDKTAEVAEQAGARVIRHPTNGGYGVSLKTGITQARFPRICITDADGTYPVEEIPRLAAFMDRFDMVVGARTGSHYWRPLLKGVARFAYLSLVRFVTGERIPDANSGLRIFRRDLVLPLFPYLSNGFSFTTTLTLTLHCQGRFVKYVPVPYRERKAHSKVRIVRDTLRTSQFLVEAILRYNPIKAILPVAFLAGLIGVATLAAYLVGGGLVWGFAGVLFLFGALLIFALGLIAYLIKEAAAR